MAPVVFSPILQLQKASVSAIFGRGRCNVAEGEKEECCGKSFARASRVTPTPATSTESLLRNVWSIKDGLCSCNWSARAVRCPDASGFSGKARSKIGARFDARDIYQNGSNWRGMSGLQQNRGHRAVKMESRPSAETTSLVASEEPLPRKVGATDLLIVGTGVLGTLVGQQWLKEFEGSGVTGETNTTAHHEEISAAGIFPVIKGSNVEKFPYVIFCAPPSGSLDYPAEVRKAAERWNGEGCLLFTSSTGVYDVNDNNEYDEDKAPVFDLGKGSRTDALLNAEAETLKVGGNVVRLAGLYTIDRGAHVFYLKKGSVEAQPDHIINVIHYEDAATLCVAILKSKRKSEIFLGCDSTPLTRQELMNAVCESGKFEGKFEGFTGLDGPLGKKLRNHSTREATGWKPKYESFRSFVECNQPQTPR